METSEIKSDLGRRSRLGVTGLMSLIACVGCAVWRVFSYEMFTAEYYYLPGVGVTVTATVMLTAAVLLAKQSGRLRVTPFGIACLACAEGIALSYGLYGSFQMRLVNLPVIAAFFVYAMYVLTSPDGSAICFNGLVRAAGRAFVNCFRSVSVPFRALSGALKGRKRARAGAAAAIGIWMAVAVVAIVCVLLAGADAMFSHVFDGLKQGLQRLSLKSLIRPVFLAFPLGLVLFSQVFSPSLGDEPHEKRGLASAAPSLFVFTLAGLTAAFALFGYIQVKYLFLGREAALMEGGFAAYARSGFFELTGVAFISLLVVQPALSFCGDRPVIRGLCLAVSVLTQIIVMSAFMRMRLYVLEYGLTILRVLVVWAIAVMFVCFAVTAVKSVKPRVRMYAPIVLVVMLSWTALSLANPARIIVDFNVNAYENGSMEHIDRDYLYGLMPASAEALERLKSLPDETERDGEYDPPAREDIPSFQWSAEFEKLK